MGKILGQHAGCDYVFPMPSCGRCGMRDAVYEREASLRKRLARWIRAMRNRSWNESRRYGERPKHMEHFLLTELRRDLRNRKQG